MESKIKKHIIAIGGGGFHKYRKFSTNNVSIEQYFLEQTQKEQPKICFIPTASGEAEKYIIDFYQAFSHYNCIPSHLSLFTPHTKDLETFILAQDAIYVGGGNTKSMLALWKEWNLDTYLKRAWEQGIVLGGASAGSICWFEEGVTDSIPGGLTALKALGFLKGSNCPHYDGEVERKPAYHKLLHEEQLSAGIAIDDNVAVHFIDNNIAKIIKRNPGGNAYHVRKHNNAIVEETL